MAEFVMKYLVEQEQLTDQYLIESAATSTHAARQMTRADYNRYDLLVGMDSANIRNMTRICGGSDPEGKIVKLLDLIPASDRRYGCDVSDPWYTGDFEATWQDVLKGCQALLNH